MKYLILFAIPGPSGYEIDGDCEITTDSAEEALAFVSGVSVGAQQLGGDITACGSFNEDQWPDELREEIGRRLSEA